MVERIWNTLVVKNRIDTTFMSPDHIDEYKLHELTMKYEQKIYHHIKMRNYTQCEEDLIVFCSELLHLSEQEQLFVVRTFYISIITNLIQMQHKKQLNHPITLSHAYQIIVEIESWENISVFILSTDWFVTVIESHLMAHYLYIDGCKHLNRALQMIHGQLTNDLLSVKWLANELGISTTYLLSIFKIQVGETVSNYITNRKIDEIVYFLIYTDKSINEIREMYGFSNKSHFTQFFKKHKRLTPLQFKKMFDRHG